MIAIIIRVSSALVWRQWQVAESDGDEVKLRGLRWSDPSAALCPPHNSLGVFRASKLRELQLAFL